MPLTYTWLPADKPDPHSINLEITAAKGSYLIDSGGKKIYDAISSWWCKPLGHRHPLVKNSIIQQLEYFEHHIPANASNGTIEQLSKRLVQIFTQMDKVMYASDGSSAVEIAMKLSYETRVLNQQPLRSKFIALSGAYHGETIFTLGVCGIASYKTNYQALIADNYFIDSIPYVNGCNDPGWNESYFDQVHWEGFFAKHSPCATALIIEPVVQGACGLKIISRDFLIKLIKVAKRYDLHIIADEIMVGLGRLGCYSVSKEFLNFEPDLVCFAKNLTAGSIAMSAVVINRSISDIFRQHDQIFPHSHTHSCNALAAAVAVNYLKWLDESDVFLQVKLAENKLQKLMNDWSETFTFIKNPRAIGAMAACKLDLPVSILKKVFALAIEEGIYLRPIGDVLYIMPPLNNLPVDVEIISPMLYSLFQKFLKI